MYLGIDLGTSGVKVIILDSNQSIVASQSEPLSVSRPQALWSEQNPLDWWQATCDAIDKISQQHDMQNIKAIGLSGQMHGATLLDKQGDILRPAILWNDGRCLEECKEIEALVPNSREIGGNIMMPGFTAPKLKWVANHEPECFAKVSKVLLPKDYLRYRLTGDFGSDMSDSAGTLLLDVHKRDWSDALLEATGLTRDHMPTLYEGCDITGTLNPELAERWSMEQVPVIAGGGDNAAGAVGVGLIKPKQAMISLGTSGVYFAVSDGCITNPEAALHSFCHALPNTWHTMSVILSAAACLDWVAKLTNATSVGEMMAEVERVSPQTNVIFLPYLSGERTPHNDPNAKGVFFGLDHTTSHTDLVQGVLEGVGFALADGLEALHSTGEIPEEITLIGGGAQSAYWRQLLADILQMPLTYREGGEVGPALGAARLAYIATADEGLTIDDICPQPPVVTMHKPNTQLSEQFEMKRNRYKAIYTQLKDLF